MNAPRVYADFHSADEKGRLRLGCVGTLQDLSRQRIVLREGLHLTLYSEDLEVEGRVHFSADENTWVAAVNWDAIREVEIAKPDNLPSALPKSA